MKLANGKEGCDNCGACFTCGTPKRPLNGKIYCPKCFEIKSKQ
jgi:formylmethanofuran dehydrogenase subunit E